MTECSKPLDLVKNKIFFFGAAEAADPDARTSARTHHETASFFDMAREHNSPLRCEKRISAAVRFQDLGGASNTTTNGEKDWRSAGLRHGASGLGSRKGAGPEVGVPVGVSKIR